MDIKEMLGFQPDFIFFVALALGTPLRVTVTKQPFLGKKPKPEVQLYIIFWFFS